MFGWILSASSHLLVKAAHAWCLHLHLFKSERLCVCTCGSAVNAEKETSQSTTKAQHVCNGRRREQPAGHSAAILYSLYLQMLLLYVFSCLQILANCIVLQGATEALRGIDKAFPMILMISKAFSPGQKITDGVCLLSSSNFIVITIVTCTDTESQNAVWHLTSIAISCCANSQFVQSI